LGAGRGTPIWDRLVFNKIRNAILGPNVWMLISGSAPLSAPVQDFLRVYVSSTSCVHTRG
jgi:long-subunit acyl-CoA synthetase (AMP-forming)